MRNTTDPPPAPSSSLSNLPRNVWVVSITSFLTDISSEMVLNLLPLFLAEVLGVRTSVIGLIEGVAEAIASILKLFSGWLSDRMNERKWLAVLGYSLSTLSKPLFYFAATWGAVAIARWGDRTGKGIRTAPRDALVADSVSKEQRGIAFGFHRAADTAGAMIGLVVALVIVWRVQASAPTLQEATFRTIALVSLVPALLAVIALAVGARDVAVAGKRPAPKFALRSLGKPFTVFVVIVSIFTLGNSSDAFLVLRAQDRGLSVLGVLGMLITFNLVYTLVSTPAGSLSDRIGRNRLILGGWLFYAAVYLGFGLAHTGWQVWALYAFYGLYYGMAYGTALALVADLVPAEVRGTAYGTYNAVLGIMMFPASLIAGLLWQGVGGWPGFGASAPFLFGAAMALLAAVLMAFWLPRVQREA
jgi:MFS family permease